MSSTFRLATIVIAAAAVALTRFLPFLAFRPGRPVPAFVQFLGRHLAPAVFGLLVVYCLRDVDWRAAPHGLPELVGCAATAALQVATRQMTLSMAGGTAAYLALSRLS